MLAIGNPLIVWLKGLKGTKWSPREDTPDSHLQKAGTPSMGGIGIIGAAFLSLVSCILFFVVSLSLLAMTQRASEIALIFVFPLLVVLHALLGFADDWSKARGKGGLLARQKLAGQVALAIGFLALIIAYSSPRPPGFVIHQGDVWIWPVTIVLCVLVIIGTSNAVNLTDGIDGLAAGLSVQVGLIFAILMFDTTSMRGITSVSAIFFWLCLGGACLGFLSFNKYPAKVFMGDTGSLALGAALGAGAILTSTVFLLPFIGFIFFVEMFSVILQVLYFKWTKRQSGEGRRIFRRAPLHHHFELGGWSERRVVWTFWLVNLLTSIVGLALWYLEILPRFP